MLDRVKKRHPALKHGGYATTTILPGESAAEFEKLHRKLIAELTPNGALEEDIVATIARLLWRKQNLATFRIAELARDRCERLKYEMVPRPKPLFVDIEVDPAKREAAIQAAEDQARKEFGDIYELVAIGPTVDRLMNELEVLDRLDAIIDKCLKRLLFLRGLKSISRAMPPKPIAGPSKAA